MQIGKRVATCWHQIRHPPLERQKIATPAGVQLKDAVHRRRHRARVEILARFGARQLLVARRQAAVRAAAFVHAER